MIFEICIDGLPGLRAAQDTGADRVELCAGLIEGGTTPSRGLIEAAVAMAGPVRVHVLIRPRGGDFVYSAEERAIMRRDVAAAVDAGAPGVVIGALTSGGEIDAVCVRELIDAAQGRSVTFHRAFDHSTNPRAALEQLITLDIDRILTSGQQATAAEGAALLTALHQEAAGRIGILAGGGIDAATVASVVATGVSELHFSARVAVDAPDHAGAVSFGPPPMRTSPERIREIMTAARRAA